MKYNPNEVSPYDSIFKEQAELNGLNYEFLRKLAWTESGFKADAQSPTGPKGIMQFTEATGRAMGLRIDKEVDERLDPTKAIPAAARHLKELISKSNGDEARAALMYNQGEGKLGIPQLQGYDSGDYSKISEEGRRYVEGITGKKLVASTVGITPQAKPFVYDKVESTTDTKGVQDYQSPILDFLNKPAEVKHSPSYYLYGEMDERDSVDTFEGLGDSLAIGLKNSTLGQFILSLPEGNLDASLSIFNPAPTYDFDEESKQYIFDNLKDLNKVNALSGIKTFDGLVARVNQLNKVYDDEITMSTYGTGSQVLGGFASAFGDPWTYVPIVGAAGKAAKGASMVSGMASVGAQTAVAAGIGESWRSTVVGGDAHLEGAILGGFAMGAAFKGLANAYHNYKGLDYNVDEVLTRAESRMRAEQTPDGVDASKVNVEDIKFPDGAQYVDHPTEDGAVILRDGTVISRSNPLNPHTVEKYKNAEKAIRGYKEVDFGGLTDIATKVYKAEDVGILSMANDFMRPISGSDEAITKMTVEDIHSYEQGYNNIAYSNVNDLMQILTKREASLNPNLSREDIIQKVGRKITEVREGSLKANLDPNEKDLLEQVASFFDRKEDNLFNPSKYGNLKAKSILEKEQKVDGYVPVDYDKGTTMEYRELFTPNGLKDALKRSYLRSYAEDPKVRERVDYGVGLGTKEFSEKAGVIHESDYLQIAVEEYAEGVARAIAFDLKRTSSSKVDDLIYDGDALLGIENNNFLEERHLFGNSFEVPVRTPNGEVINFSPNDLRNFDLLNLMGRYARRVDGDVAIMGGTGKSTKDIKQELTEFRQEAVKHSNKKNEEAAVAIGEFIKVITGRARRNPASILETATKSLGDLVLLNKGWYIPIMNLTETGGMVGMGNMGAITRNIPILKQLSNVNTILSPEEVSGLRKAIFGEELSAIIRPRKADIIQSLKEVSGKPIRSTMVGSMKYYTGEATAKTIGRLMNGTTNLVINKAREGVIGDLVGEAFEVSARGSWATEGILKVAGVSKEQYDDILNLIRETVVKNEDGSFKIKDADKLQKDPRTMALWRLGDYIARDTMLQPHRASRQSFKEYNAYIKAALMFKRFSASAINGKMMSSWHQATKNGRAFEKSKTLAASMVFAALGYMGTVRLKALGMNEKDSKKFLEDSLDPAVVMMASGLRSSELGSMGIALNILAMGGWTPARQMKNTLNTAPSYPKAEQGESSYSMLHRFGGRVMEQVPAANLVFETLALGYNATQLATTKNYASEYKIRKQISKNIRNLVPNDFATQKAIISLLESTGMPTDR